MKMLQIKKIAFAIVLILAGAVSAFAQQRDNRDKGNRQPHIQNNNQRQQQHINRQPQRQPSVNRTPANTQVPNLSLIHISEPTRQAEISYAVFCLKKKKK